MGLHDPASITTLIKRKGKDAPKIQFGTLVYRIQNDKTQVLLITSRGTGRWIVPKGWPMGGLKPHQAAAREAWEEAGVLGRVGRQCIGLYTYDKIDGKTHRRCTVLLFPLKASKLSARFPERRERRRKWLSPKKAALRVDNADLAQIIASFDPRQLP